MSTNARTILFAGGGSGGHIAPLLAVMEAVQKQEPDVQCAYVGLKSDLESLLIVNSSLQFKKYAIRSGKLHRFVTVDQFRQLGHMVSGLVEAEQLISKVKPDIVFCKGSMLSVPVALAAKRRGIPVYSHETDLVPGLANRIIARFAKGIFTAFPVEAYTRLPKHKLIYTGQPLDPDFFKKTEASVTVGGRKLQTDRPIVTVVGGSQGAHRINVLVSESWDELLKDMTIVHICGALDLPKLTTKSAGMTKELQNNLYLTDFQSEHVAELFRMSSLVISRAGGTVFALAASGVPTLLLPLSTAAQNHQWANANYFNDKGAALVVDETIITSSELTDIVQSVLADEDKRTELSTHIRTLARPESAADMARTLLA